ncbi:MAG: VCBS repeat-containing protein, partial [Lentisphaeria bacterium]|nr:VCBS repeat-containing protein [Lentisphaeria bacterium]
SLQIAGGAVVSAYSGSVIDFTVADRKTSDGYLINDLSLINGAPDYTITVNKNQKAGTYKLAQGASNFSGSITIGNGTVDYGTITVNGADVVHNGVTYSLDNVSGNLTLTVSGNTHPDGDLDGNGYADTILVNTKQGYSGAWMTTETKSVILWGNLGNVNSKVELVGMGNVKGTSTNGSDIIMKIGTTVAAWVTDGGKVKSYKELYTLKSNMNMLGIGDFDGDGVTDYLLRSTAGDLGYVTGDDNKWHYIKGLGKEWKIAAVGDLDGNGTDDVIVRHDAGFTGAYMIDTNGKITWSNLDTLKSDMTIVGTGDFNGDGVDDVLLQNKSNGWVGAWLVEDGRVDSFIGLCNNKNTIEQIADYNGDGIDDLRIRTEKGDIGVLYVNGADNTTWKYFQSVGKEWDTSFALLS